jgi:pimeloyl-ACP methyl ester carboxylesterase
MARVRLAGILRDTAERLVERDPHEVAGGWTWRGDIRLRHPSMRSFTEDQVLAHPTAITAPALLVLAERAAPAEEFHPGRIAAVPGPRRVTPPGGHHLRMENPVAVTDAVREFRARSDCRERAARRTVGGADRNRSGPGRRERRGFRGRPRSGRGTPL